MYESASLAEALSQFPPMTVAATLRTLLSGNDLDESASVALIGEVMDGVLTPAQTGALLAALAAKGESVAEIAGAARAMRDRSLHVHHTIPVVLDIVGTGGDGAHTINISTLAALVVAASGVAVAKHGNRAASSACGSADVLEAAGFSIDRSPEAAAALLERCGFTFLFAPRYHPAMKNVAPIRRELGVRTLFNILGPLTNPAAATHAVVGVARDELVDLVAEVLQRLGVRAAAVVHAESGLDEVAGQGVTRVFQFDEERTRRWNLDAAAYGIDVSASAIRVDSVDAALNAFNDVLDGGASPASDVVALNAALALVVACRAESLEDGLTLARQILASGEARALFERVKQACDD